jgi:hypothetical protein
VRRLSRTAMGTGPHLLEPNLNQTHHYLYYYYYY